MENEAPVVRLTDAILLSALARGAQQVRIRARDRGSCVVELQIDGQVHEEMRPPALLLAPIVRRLSIMASLPIYPRGGSASGFLHLRIGEVRAAYFAIVVTGHGAAMSATLREITEEEYNKADPSGSTGIYR
ncbi:MAG TPA: hypothetical protein VGD37_13075 [Kofleriaceae bacterium]